MSDEFGNNLASTDDIPRQITGEAREKLEQFIEKHGGEDTDYTSSSSKVTKDLCDLIHEMKEEGVQVKKIAETVGLKSPSAVYYHLREDCSHEQSNRITYSECGWMRVHAQRGAPSSTLSMFHGAEQEIITRHVTGKCTHEDGIEPLDGSELRKNSVSEVTTVTSTCPVCEEEFEHPEYRKRTCCSSQCNTKYASMVSHGQI